MKTSNKTYVGAAIYFDRLPDNEWLEDSDTLRPDESADSSGEALRGCLREVEHRGVLVGMIMDVRDCARELHRLCSRTLRAGG
jgi:hypothetical protein